MNYKKWIQIWFLIVSIFPIIGILNYFIDPYGLKDKENKFIGVLTDGNNPSILNLKINLDADYYLIGSSRLMRVNPLLIEHYLENKNVFNVNISGATFKENFIIANKVKANNKNFIFGLDAFTLNQSRYSSGAISSRYNTYKNALNVNSTYQEYLSYNYIAATLKDIKKRILNKQLDEYFLSQDNIISSYTIDDIEKKLDISNKSTHKHFTNFKLPDDKMIIKLAKEATKDDIFIIYPKYYQHYILFNQYQNIEKKYFQGIQLLVTNTKAKVWSFYGINSITEDPTNFDDTGWHFKPRISKLIFAKVFNNTSINIPDDFGILLTDKNINSHLQKITKKIISKKN